MADAIFPAPRNAILFIGSNILADGFFDRVHQNRLGAAAGSIMQRGFTAQISQGMSRNGQTHANANGVFLADERFENVITYFGIKAPALILHCDFNHFGFGIFLNQFGVDPYGSGLAGPTIITLPCID